jgi:hypothetical protein
LKEKEDKLARATEYEIRELLEWGYDREEILNDEIIMRYRELDRELDVDVNKEKVKEELDEYIELLKLAKEITGKDIEENNRNNEENKNSEDNKENKNLEKLFEDEEKDENKTEKFINIDKFHSRQDSDQEKLNLEDINISDNKSDISDFYIENLFEETDMATEGQVKRALERALGLPDGSLNAPLAAGVDLAARIDDTRNELGGIINMPMFNGKEDEDVGDWIRQFEVAFTASGKNDNANGTRKAAIAATCLRGSALQWYNRMKEAAAGNLVNWANNDNDNDFKHRIDREFTRPDVRRRKMIELGKIRQNNDESVKDYTRRFRNILRIATRGNALHDDYQVDFYIRGLEPTVGYNVRRQNPANLNDAVRQARREEEARNELIRRTTGIDVG